MFQYLKEELLPEVDPLYYITKSHAYTAPHVDGNVS